MKTASFIVWVLISDLELLRTGTETVEWTSVRLGVYQLGVNNRRKCKGMIGRLTLGFVLNVGWWENKRGMMGQEKELGSRAWRNWIQKIMVNESEKADCSILEGDLSETEIAEGYRFYWWALMVIMGLRHWRKVRETFVGNEKLMKLRSLEVSIIVVRGKSPMNEKDLPTSW